MFVYRKLSIFTKYVPYSYLYVSKPGRRYWLVNLLATRIEGRNVMLGISVCGCVCVCVYCVYCEYCVFIKGERGGTFNTITTRLTRYVSSKRKVIKPFQ